MLQALIPGMEHAEEADLGSQVPGITGDLQQSCSTSVKQQVIDQPFILQCERSQFPRQGEDDVHVAGGQQLSFTRLEPPQARIALTLGAVPVTARVVGDGSRMSAIGTAITVPAQRGGAAASNGQQHLLMLPTDPLAAAFKKRLPRTTNDVGHLQRRSVHALCVCSPSPRIVSASSGLPVALRWRRERCR